MYIYQLNKEKQSAKARVQLFHSGILIPTGHRTFPVVRARGPKQDEVVVWGETDGKTLLTEAKLLVTLRPTLTELPFSSVQVVSLR